MAVRFSTGLRDNMLGSADLKTSFTNGVIYIYSGAQPSTADGAATGTLLGKVTLDAGAFAHGVATNGLNFDAPVAGVLSKAAAENWRFTGITGGTAGWFRFAGNANDDGLVSTTLTRIDGSIAKTGGDMTLSTTAIVVGAPSTVDIFQLSMAAN